MKAMNGMAMIAVTALLLTGCMYPGTGTEGSGVTTGEYIVPVENAVIAYKERTGVLPIHNSTENTPIYEKYRIHFKKLLDYGMISRVPPDAFEKGGNYYYMVIDPEEEPRIKLMDLRTSQSVADMQRLVDDYRLREGVSPLGDEVRPHFFTIDFDKLNKRQQQIKSVYSGLFLTYLMHESGIVAIEYAPEIMKAVGKSGSGEPDGTTDLRKLLIEQSPFVPVSSYPYHWENGEPVISEQ